MMELVLERDPAFGEAWSEYLSSRDPGELSPYSDIDVYLEYVCQLMRAGKRGADRSFQVVEALLRQGDEDVQTVVTLGFLESLTNIALNGNINPALFVSLLGPLSAEACRELDVGWGTRLPGLWPESA
jgi:hypothetical protein